MTRTEHGEIAAADMASATDREERPEEIRAEIEETQEELGGTLDEIGTRLDPGHLVDQAKENVRSATIGRVEDAVSSASETARGAGSSMLDTMKRNPIPTAMAGIGLTWLWMSRSNGHQAQRDRFYRDGYPGWSRYEPGGRSPGVGGFADQARQSAGDAVSNVQHTAGEVAGNVGQVAGHVASQGQQTVEQAGSQAQRLLHENPFAAGAIALAAGAAFGMLVPETKQEREVLGEPSRQIGERVQEVASDAVDKAQRIADRAETAAEEEAKAQGIARG